MVFQFFLMTAESSEIGEFFNQEHFTRRPPRLSLEKLWLIRLSLKTG
jgi:hypothetical protein